MSPDPKAYVATALAKSIANAPDDELRGHLASAALSPTIFKSLFKTFHGDEVTPAKLRQRAADLGVHPDQTEDCVALYVSSLEFAGLLTVTNDKISHQKGTASEESSETEVILEVENEDEGLFDDDLREADQLDDDSASLGAGKARAVFHVNVNLDASLDTEKLQRQLELLRKYGAI